MDEEYDVFFDRYSKIIKKDELRLKELNNLRNKMFNEGLTYDSKIIQDNLIETRKIYMEQEKEFYDLLGNITDCLNQKKNEEKEKLQELKFLRNEKGLPLADSPFKININ